jgi:hypothetical protein
VLIILQFAFFILQLLSLAFQIAYCLLPISLPFFCGAEYSQQPGIVLDRFTGDKRPLRVVLKLIGRASHAASLFGIMRLLK